MFITTKCNTTGGNSLREKTNQDTLQRTFKNMNRIGNNLHRYLYFPLTPLMTQVVYIFLMFF